MEPLVIGMLGLLLGGLGLQLRTSGAGAGAAADRAGHRGHRRPLRASPREAREGELRTRTMAREMRNHGRRLEALLAFRERALRDGDIEAVALAHRLIRTEMARHEDKLLRILPER